MYNAQTLSSLSYDCPIVIAGNRCAAEECQEILGERTTFLCENVMPKLGELNIEPTQKQIRESFYRDIVQEKGLSGGIRIYIRNYYAYTVCHAYSNGVFIRWMEELPGIGELVGVDLGGAYRHLFHSRRKSG